MSWESVEDDDKGLTPLLDRELCPAGKCCACQLCLLDENVLLGKQKEHRLEVPVSQGWKSASQRRLSHLLRWLTKPNSNQIQPWVCCQILTCPANWLWRVSISIPASRYSWLCCSVSTNLHPCFQPGSARSFPVHKLPVLPSGTGCALLGAGGGDDHIELMLLTAGETPLSWGEFISAG